MAAADRGKVAEKKLQDAFKAWEKQSHTFCHERILDARSSLGKSSNPRAGDFVLYDRGCNILIECKEVDHEYRLNCANFELDQRARMRKRQYAGSICRVVVYHSPTGLWRVLALDYFGLQEKGSWDLREIPPRTLPQVIETLKGLVLPT